MGRGKHNKGSAGRVFDKNLGPRIEEYALNHDISDIDDVVDHLRRSYKEYQRKPVAALRQMVSRSLQVVQSRGVSKPELQLQVVLIHFVLLLALDNHKCWGQLPLPAAAAAGCCGSCHCCCRHVAVTACRRQAISYCPSTVLRTTF